MQGECIVFSGHTGFFPQHIQGVGSHTVTSGMPWVLLERAEQLSDATRRGFGPLQASSRALWAGQQPPVASGMRLWL